MRRLAALTAAGLCLLLAGTTTAAPRRALVGRLTAPTIERPPAQTTEFVNLLGQPTGGKWQDWVNDSHVPTYGGTILLVLSSAPCGNEALGCAEAGWCPPTLRECAQNGVGPVIFTDPNDRFTFFHELGHEFDWAYLTDTDRRELLRMMGERGAPWVEDGAQDDFADLYATCAEGYGTGEGSFNPNGWSGIPVVGTLDALNDVCSFIVRVAMRW